MRRYEEQKKYYDRIWFKNKRPCIDEKCRRNFIIFGIKRIRSSKENLSIIDLGCGRGWLTQELSKYGDVIGVDISTTVARKIYPSLNFKERNIITEHIEGKYDVVVSSEILEHLTDRDQEIYMKKCWSILKDEGYLLLTTPNRPVIEKMVDEGLIVSSQMQPIENWLDKKGLISLLKPYFKIVFMGSTMFCSAFFYRSTKQWKRTTIFRMVFSMIYYALYSSGFYRFVDRFLRFSYRGRYLTIISKRAHESDFQFG